MSEYRKYRPESSSKAQLIFWSTIFLGATVLAMIAEAKHKRFEAQCPGEKNVAIGESTSFLDGTTTINVHPYLSFLSKPIISFSAVDNGETIFGGVIPLDAGETTTINGIDFRERGTRDQSVTGDILSFTLGGDECVSVELP